MNFFLHYFIYFFIINLYFFKNKIGEKSSGYEPAASRIRFEGLLESAIQLYSNPENVSLPSTASAQNTLSRPKENRGKSAIVTRYVYLKNIHIATRFFMN